MKAAMQYQNKTPEEIVRQYKKKLRAKQGASHPDLSAVCYCGHQGNLVGG